MPIATPASAASTAAAIAAFADAAARQLEALGEKSSSTSPPRGRLRVQQQLPQPQAMLGLRERELHDGVRSAGA
jgi:hypothetical protein